MSRQRQLFRSIVDAHISAYMDLVSGRQDLTLALSGAAFVKAVAAVTETFEAWWPENDSETESGSEREDDAEPSSVPSEHLLFPAEGTLPAAWPPRYRRLCCEAAAMTIIRMEHGSKSLLEYVVNTVSVEMLRCIRETQTVLRAAFGLDRVDETHKRRIAAVLDADHATITKRSRLTNEKKGLEKVKATIEAKFGRSEGDEWGDV